MRPDEQLSRDICDRYAAKDKRIHVIHKKNEGVARDRNDDIMEVLRKFGIKYCFYGHLHGYAHKNAVIGEREGIEFRLISSDFLHFSPFDITNIVKKHEK